MAEPQAQTQSSSSHTAGCHCGYISLSLTLEPALAEYNVVHCNCSICTRLGYMLVYPTYDQVTWHNDSKARCSSYQFNTKTRDHLFCPRCGASIGIDFREMDPKRYGISLRAFNEVDLDGIRVKKIDGRHKLPPYRDLSGTEYADTKTGDAQS